MRRIVTLAAALVGLLAHSAVADQLVVLDFDTFTDGSSDDGLDHVYSVGERLAIVDILNDKFAPFPVSFTATAPADTDPPFGLYSKVYFNTGLSSAGDIDFQNKKKIDDASIHIPKLLEIAGVTGPYTPEEIIISSVNIAAHETLHLLGTRHHDSFLPIGFGVPGPGFLDDFDPVFPGPPGAFLTGKEFNSLTTSIGFSAAKLLDPDLFIGPRSAVKLLHEEFIDLDVDSSNANDIFAPQPLELKTIPIPWLGPSPGPGLMVEMFADVVVVEEASLVPGDPPFDTHPAPDYYVLVAEEGDILHIEVLSEILGFRLGDTVDTKVALLDPTTGYAPVPWFSGTAINNDERESTDSFLWDVIIPATGTYLIEVFPNPDGTDELGEYEMLVYRFHTMIVPEPSSLVLSVFGLFGVAAMVRRRMGK